MCASVFGTTTWISVRTLWSEPFGRLTICIVLFSAIRQCCTISRFKTRIDTTESIDDIKCISTRPPPERSGSCGVGATKHTNRRVYPSAVQNISSRTLISRQTDTNGKTRVLLITRNAHVYQFLCRPHKK